MLQIPVFSDTHLFKGKIEKCAHIAKNYEFFFHLGDNLKDAVEISKLSGKKGYMVLGNTDIAVKGEEEIILELEGVKILLTHGHKFRVKGDVNTLLYYCEENGIDLALFGHSHVSMVEYHNNILIVNPGSASLPRDGSVASYALVTISDRKASAEIIPL